MKQFTLAIVTGATLFSTSASAQLQAPPPARAYIQALGGWTFGDKGSQFFGGEGGLALKPAVDLFVEGGKVRNAAGAALTDAAQTLSDALARAQTGVTLTATQPVTYFDAGLRLHMRVSGSKIEPFVLAGGGAAHVKQDVTFMAGGNDVTGSLPQYGVALGSDLSGSFTKASVVIGGGLTVPLGRRFMAEIGYRYTRIFAEDQAININRAGLAFGARF